MYAAELPDPFPNSEVKRGRADDSLVHASAKVGSCPFMLKLSFTGEFFRWVDFCNIIMYCSLARQLAFRMFFILNVLSAGSGRSALFFNRLRHSN